MNRNNPDPSRDLILMPMLNVLNVRLFFFALACSCCYSVASAAEDELSSKSRSEARNVKVAPSVSEASSSLDRPGSDNYWILGRWSLSGYYDVEAKYGCSIEKVNGFWPVMGECRGDLDLMVNRERFIQTYDEAQANLEAQEAKERKRTDPLQWYARSIEYSRLKGDLLDRRLQAQSMLIREGWKVPAFMQRSAHPDFAAIQRGSHVLTFGGEFFEPQDFGRIAEKGIDEVQHAVHASIAKDRRDIVIGVSLSALGLVLAAYLSMLLYRFARKRFVLAKEKAKQLKDVAADQVDKLQAAHQRRKVRAVVMDETIREMTRSAVGEADARSKELLVAELRKAIESGNHELANALELALKKT